jgi:LCP family protein required for cell wall assembly
VFQGGFFGLMQKQPLKQDANGRSNFLIFGTEEEGHPGANLTDSIMVLSVNQETKDAFMISIPRDLWVDYGSACTSGYRGKVNAVYTCASNDGEDQAAGTAALQRKIGSILGLDIQYYVHINFAALQEIVDAVGGVTVTVESNPKGMGILDRNFDWRCQYKCYYVKYKDGETVHLDGEHALALARARNAQGGYGLADSNFDREKNQQKIIRALREKALNVGTLTNLGKVTSLMDALGNNLKTNIDKKEIQTLMSLASDIKNEDIRSLALNDEKDPLVTTGNIEGQSSVFPVAGTYIYGDIQAFIKKNSVNNPVSREGAKVVVLNGTSVAGVAGKEAAVLTGAGYIVSDTDDAPAGTYAAIEVYKIGSGNTATTDALQKRYGVTVKTTSPPLSVSSDVSFVVVVGRAR